MTRIPAVMLKVKIKVANKVRIIKNNINKLESGAVLIHVLVKPFKNTGCSFIYAVPIALKVVPFISGILIKITPLAPVVQELLKATVFKLVFLSTSKQNFDPMPVLSEKVNLKLFVAALNTNALTIFWLL